jgi:hypothetical protein
MAVNPLVDPRTMPTVSPLFKELELDTNATLLMVEAGT